MIASALRWLFLCSAIFLCGTLGLLWQVRGQFSVELSRWRARCVDAACVLAVLALVFAFAAAAAQALQITQSSLAEREALQRFFLSTRAGQVWVARFALLVLTLLAVLAWRRRLVDARQRARVAACAVLALAALALGGGSGHAAAFDPAWPVMTGQALHLAAVGLWLGALPALAYLHYSHSAQHTAAAVLRGFSQRALLLMLVIIASGVPLADLQVERIPALIGTHYGVTLIWKLVFLAAVLAAAAHLRFVLLPRLVVGSAQSPLLLARWIVIELLLALGAVWCATELSRTVPARHDAIVWPFDFRYSVDATWPDPKLRERIIGGAVIAIVGVLFAWIGFVQCMRVRRWLPPFLVLLIAGLWLSLSAMETDAYPGTYRKTTVPYQAISVANGARMFAQYCVSCHGHAGHGDGPQARILPLRPADLTEAHTALHTAGDLFWWITHGKPPGVMPGFAEVLSEDERWDVINFLRALSAGYQARIIGERSVPRKPWLAAPDFSFVTANGESGTLKDFRGERAVLLIAGTRAALGERLAQLTAHPLPPAAALLVASRDSMPGSDAALADSIVVEGSEEILTTYGLLRRTLANADPRDVGVAPAHIEFLIDRFGYVRARWLPSENPRGWRDLDLLHAQIEVLALEPRVLSPPDDHVH